MDIKRDHPPGMALVGGQYGAMESTPIPLDAVQFTDAWLAKHIAVQGLYANRTATQTIQVSARLVNCSDKSIAIGARTSFINKSQGPAEAPTMWRTQVISPRATALYQESSVATDVAHYLIEIRPNAQAQMPTSQVPDPMNPL